MSVKIHQNFQSCLWAGPTAAVAAAAAPVVITAPAAAPVVITASAAAAAVPLK